MTRITPAPKPVKEKVVPKAPAAAKGVARKVGTKAANAQPTASKSINPKSTAASKAKTTKASAKRTVNAVLSDQTGEQPVPKVTQTRAVFPLRSNTAVNTRSSQIAPTRSQSQDEPLSNATDSDADSNGFSSTAGSIPASQAFAEVSDKLDLQRKENEKLLRKISELTGLIATQKPLADIPRPELPKSSPMKLATVDVILGLAAVPGGDEELNQLRKKMISWIWDTVHDVIFMHKVEQKFPRLVTYDGLTKPQGDHLVACIMEQIRSVELMRRPFFKQNDGAIPRFHAHWPIRELIKTVLLNEKKAAGRVSTGVKDMTALFNSLSPTSQQGLCDPPTPLVNKTPKIPGAGPGRPPKVPRVIACSSSPLAPVERGPRSSRFSEFLPSPSPLREFQENLSNFTLNELMAQSDSDIISEERAVESDIAEEALEDDPFEPDHNEARNVSMETSDEEDVVSDEGENDEVELAEEEEEYADEELE